MKRLKFEKFKTEIDSISKEEKITGYQVTNKHNELIAHITCQFWNRWTLQPCDEMIFSRGCLKEIYDFMDSLGGKD